MDAVFEEVSFGECGVEIQERRLQVALVGQAVWPEDWQLYNLAKDPGETDDLSERMPELRSEMVEIWSRYSEETGVILPSINILSP